MTDPVRQIADAVLYEGYALWPYRRSAPKNRRWLSFGGVYPRGWPEDPSRLQAQCLLDGGGELDVTVRFLHVAEGDMATEREVVARGAPTRVAIAIEADDGWSALEGVVDVAVEPLAPTLARVTVAVENTASWTGEPRKWALARSFCSTHAILHARGGGGFVSQIDPPQALHAAAEACRSEGLWPVLVGDRSTVLAAPIILEDYPRIAPESPGDAFDSTEIDGLLMLSVLALSDEEKAEIRASDPRIRAILERAEALTPEAMARLHGALR